MSLKKKEIGDRSGGLWGGALLIAGTSIGAGMLALPVVTGPGGFYPAIVINFFCWAIMAATGLLFMEATLLLPDGANVLSITKKFLGKTGEWIGGSTFVFLYYCLMVAYLSGGAPLLNHFFDIKASLWVFGLFFALIVWEGSRFIDRTNWLLMSGLIISYFLMMSGAGNVVDSVRFDRVNWGLSLLAAPTLFSAFGYHNIIPSLATYLHRDRSLLRWAILIGSAIPLVVYTLWQWLIIGAIPEGMLEVIGFEGIPVGLMLERVTGNPWVSATATYFSFFAIVTSLLGVSLSMVDFLGDGLKVKRTGWSRLGLVALVFIPPMIVSSLYPTLFISALGIAGGIGEAIINCLIPIALVWVARYQHKSSNQHELPGGRLTLSVLAAGTVAIMLLEMYVLAYGSSK